LGEEDEELGLTEEEEEEEAVAEGFGVKGDRKKDDEAGGKVEEEEDDVSLDLEEEEDAGEEDDVVAAEDGDDNKLPREERPVPRVCLFAPEPKSDIAPLLELLALLFVLDPVDAGLVLLPLEPDELVT